MDPTCLDCHSTYHTVAQLFSWVNLKILSSLFIYYLYILSHRYFSLRRRHDCYKRETVYFFIKIKNHLAFLKVGLRWIFQPTPRKWFEVTLVDIVGNRGLPCFMFFAFLVKKTFGILFFCPSYRKPARESDVRGNLFEKQRFICYRPVNMIQQN